MRVYYSFFFLIRFNIKSRDSPSSFSSCISGFSSQNGSNRPLIFKQGDKYFGKLSWIKDAAKKDVNNPDASLRNQPLLGLVILKNFEFTGKAWEEGSIYDPKNGKSYSCNMKLKKADELEIRGFVGVSLLGRTTVWTKVK